MALSQEPMRFRPKPRRCVQERGIEGLRHENILKSVADVESHILAAHMEPKAE
jgi:hypothetical protein